MTDTDRISDFAERINETLAQQLDYAETHTDAGNAYSHLPREGGWAYSNGDKRLEDWLTRHDIPRRGLEIDEISDIVLDNFNMVSGTILDPAASDDSLFVIDSYPVSEVESQIDLGTLLPEATEEERHAAREEADAHFGSPELAYQVSDRVWYAIIDRATLAEALIQAT